jgi:hypothetical protein
VSNRILSKEQLSRIELPQTYPGKAYGLLAQPRLSTPHPVLYCTVRYRPPGRARKDGWHAARMPANQAAPDRAGGEVEGCHLVWRVFQDARMLQAVVMQGRTLTSWCLPAYCLGSPALWVIPCM